MGPFTNYVCIFWNFLTTYALSFFCHRDYEKNYSFHNLGGKNACIGNNSDGPTKFLHLDKWLLGHTYHHHQTHKLKKMIIIHQFQINTSYLTDSYISFTLKLESGQHFCSNRSIRSSTNGKKNIFEIPPCGSHFLLIHFTY